MASSKKSLQQLTFRSALHWLSENLLFPFVAFLLVFVPLWPKIPLWSPIEQYIVRVRLEDAAILITAIVWVIQVLRKKATWRSPMFWGVLAYAIVGLASTLWAIFWTEWIPLSAIHLEKSFLHYFRYLEYFSLFFVMFAAVKKRRDALILMFLFAATVIAVSIYGYGQKYFYWPVYSTMNREFSKGEMLVLTPHARVQSTFAGHYDMAAFLVIALPLLLALIYLIKNRNARIFLIVSYSVGTWLITVSASRTSFVGFLGAIFVILCLLALQKSTRKQQFRFLILNTLFVFTLTGAVFLFFGEDLMDRLSQVIDSNPKLHDSFHSFNKSRKELWASLFGQKFIEVPIVIPTPVPPKGAITTDQAIQMGILSPTDERPIPAPGTTTTTTSPSPTPTPSPSVHPVATGKNRRGAVLPSPTPTPLPKPTPPPPPSDVYVEVPDIQQIASKSASGAAIVILIDKGPRVYSANAYKYGLSMAIRLDTLWPNAIDGFMNSPLLGKGYATLNKTGPSQFTEADSTDNNFLRTLGETGLLGFITFYGCVGIVLFFAVKATRSDDALSKAMGIGVIGGTVGLLLNAVFIDVFASSKVAEMYWGLMGIFLGYWLVAQKNEASIIPNPIRKKKTKKRSV